MTIEDAIRWVDANKAMIRDRAKDYSKYAPYDIEDYIQDAYQAAVEAVHFCQRNPGLKFDGVFKTIFRRNIARTTPLPEEARKEVFINKMERQKKDATKIPLRSGSRSESLPLHYQVDVPLESFPQKKNRQKINIERVYDQHVRPLLSKQEAKVMDMVLGFTMEGTFSPEEIASKLGVTRRSVRTYADRVIKKAKLINLDDAKDRLKPKHQKVVHLPEDTGITSIYDEAQS